MARPASTQKRNGKHLWFALLGLGFQPDSELASFGKINANARRTSLGATMFDKPNKDAFHIVTHFLLDKLNPTRFRESYRFCWPVLNHKADAEFRKVTCSWLREIMDESAGSKVAASLLLSPGGPKFTSLMLNLAHHVMLQEMKTFRTEDSWVPEAAAIPASSLDMAAKRLELLTRRFLRTAVEQDRFLHEYQRRAQLLVRSVKELRAEASRYQELLAYASGGRSLGWRRSFSGEGPAGEAFRLCLNLRWVPDALVRQVRSLWSSLDHMICSTRAEQEAVDGVLRGQADQYVLDGAGRVLEVPRSLREHLEQRPQKISREAVPEARSRIRELEAGWDRRWSEGRQESPLAAFLQEEHTGAALLSPMAPLSFAPLAHASLSLFSQFPAVLPEERRVEAGPPEAGPLKAEPPEAELRCCSSSSPEAAVVPVETANTSLDWLLDLSPLLRAPVAQVGGHLWRRSWAAQGSIRFGFQVSARRAGDPRSQTRTLELECDNLADQFADAVATPAAGLSGVDLEALLGSLHADPFSTRKQLPRTPESLILDVKSSWRKAVEEDRAQRLGRAQETPAGDGRSTSGPWATPTPPPPWDALAAGGLVQLGLDQETLPELPGCDSLLSLDEDEGPSPDARATPPRGGSAGRPDRGTAEKVFSLDLDHLEAPSTPKTQEYSLPSLIAFSPVDDATC
ncbi:unnamed protein product [Tetraodon nigroviridis]|uniref:(spotted green pufferfish) hypothetical protein n=1 Tax=Tetraodon nigroviridis TaxID=99883 RepID=Q4SRP9_TETNG|nr:unnamed protein product [Tetraodon nigroviridis]